MDSVECCIISSNCIAGFWYRDIVKTKYEHPFIWSIVKLSDLLFLVKNFDIVNFGNIEFIMSKGEVNRRDGDKWPKILVDNYVSAYFIHYKENKNIEKPLVKGIDVVCPDIATYTKNTWLERCKRIPYNKIRVWVHWDDYVNTDINLVEFLTIAKEKKEDIFVLFTPKKDIVALSENTIILPITNYYDVYKHTKDLENALNNYNN